MRLGEHWLTHMLLALWIALVTLLHYGQLANAVLGSFARGR